MCVEATEEKMIKQMESFGLDVIPGPFRDRLCILVEACIVPQLMFTEK